MDNYTMAEQLLTLGLNEKRKGNYEEARNFYLESLKYNNANQTAYLNLGKINYLLGNRELAICSYLANMHLQIIEREQKVRGIRYYSEEEKNFNEDFYNSFPDRVKIKLYIKSGIVILQNYNIPRHFAHALLDFTQKDIKKYANVYRETMKGSVDIGKVLKENNLTQEEYMVFDNVNYRGYGIEAFLDLIRWNKIDEDNVLKLYFKNEFRMDIKKQLNIFDDFNDLRLRI